MYRPDRLTARQLGFTPSRPVPWLAPQLLAATAIRVVAAQLSGAYLDKRELQGALPQRTFDHRDSTGGAPDGSFWFDYVADLGDGFDATYSVAWLLAQHELPVGHDQAGPVAEPVLPRGRVLVLGGDQVYPTAHWQAYEDRCKGPYRSALPDPAPDAPNLYALPGNHDWYDGLTAFLRLFAKDAWFGGWKTRQARSYFALALPRRWWLFAIDAQLDAYLDDPQLRYFDQAAAELRPGDHVILCAPKPSWVYTADSVSAFDTLDFFIRTIVEPTGAAVPMILAGDIHHYSRYVQTEALPPDAPPTDPDPDPDSDPDPGELPAEPEQPAPDLRDQPGAEPGRRSRYPGLVRRQLVTCGGGGAYLYPTDRLPRRLRVPPSGTLFRNASPARTYQLTAGYPDPDRSRRYAWGVFARLPSRNPGFGTAVAILHTLLMLAFVASREQYLTVASVGMSLLVVGIAVAMAMPETLGFRRARHWVAGFLHGTAHLGLGLAGAYLWLQLPYAYTPPPVPVLLAALLYGPVIGLVGSELVALYLLVASRFDVNVNELYASQGIEDAKSFLRLRIGPDGTLTLFPVAVDKVVHAWRAAPHDPPGSPWIAPRTELRARLAEDPVTLPAPPSLTPTDI